MHPLAIVGIVVAVLLLLTLAVSYYCYRRVFFSPPRKPMAADEYEIPPGEIYEVYSYDSNFVYIWGIKNAKFSYRFFCEHFEET